MWRSKFRDTGMNCKHCSNILEREIGEQDTECGELQGHRHDLQALFKHFGERKKSESRIQAL